MDPLPLPSSLAEVEALIRALYEPAPPQVISRIQEVLQRLQKSPEGWQLAQSLLTNSDDTVKFFGTLTVIVKLNTESSNLSDEEARELLQNLVNWVIRCLQDGSGPMVIRKLCSALATYFIHFSQLWPFCVRHLVHCLDLGRSVPVEQVGSAAQMDAVLGTLSLAKLQAALWFAASFVEDVGKTDMNSAKYIQAHDRLMQNGPEVVSLLASCLGPDQQGQPGKVKVQEEAIKCLQSWILYAQRVSSTNDILLAPLRTLVTPALNCLANDDLYDAAVELFIDVLSNYSGFFTGEHYDSLANLFESPWAQSRYQTLLQGDFDFDSVQFGSLMLAFGDAKVVDLLQGTDARSQALLSGLAGLLTAAGYPVGEDKIFVPALEFWSTFVETMTDMMYSAAAEEETPPWMPGAVARVMQVVTNCWRKIQYPPVEVFASWDSTERVGFGDARKDVADLLQAVYTLTGPPIISMFVDLLLRHLESRDWAELEAAAFCLGALSDCISDEGNCDVAISKVFSPPYFELLGQAFGPIPLRLRQTGLSLIERYSDYFERHPEHLPLALNLLFDAVGDAALGGPSAKSISTLCSSCRSILTGELGAFLRHYGTIRTTQAVDSVAEERIVLAIASVIQAVKEPSQKLQAFQQLFSYIRDDVERSLALAAQPEMLDLSNPLFRRGLEPAPTNEVPSPAEIALQLSLRALRCLASIARGMQDVSDGPIDLDATPTPEGSLNSELARVQEDILTTLHRVITTFSSSGEVVESVCNVLRAGFSETEPGPFVFPAQTITEFFVKQTINSPRIGTILSTACSFVSSLSKGLNAHVEGNLSVLLPWVIGLLQSLPDPEVDTELVQNSIDFVQRVMAKRPEVLLSLQPTSSLEFFFLFTLKVLNGRQPLSKNAAAEFWTAFISLRSDDPSTQASVASAMDHLGPLVARTLMHNIGGNASRSELDKLSEPLKKLVVQQPQAKTWLEQALFGDDFPSSHVPREERNIFLKKIINLRGSRTTNQVVKEFWLTCRGSNFTYAS
ncbi:hypothetical protein VTK73DRAFT_676 [Phialemonium thermophilum]|uniref:Exportin-1/Importin-beta-like domain-containing protein n=1 Tax=Phialemonium thermophilum TaxID=223376 RepID=A0ABR3XE85_9PEZI